MTKEIAIDILDDNFTVIDTHGHYTDEEIEEAMTMAIKALEEQQNPNSIRINFVGEEEAEEFKEYLKNQQESVLDKIRNEIEQVKSIMNEEIIDHNRKDLINFVNGLNQSLVIIDKYKAESEV